MVPTTCRVMFGNGQPRGIWLIQAINAKQKIMVRFTKPSKADRGGTVLFTNVASHHPPITAPSFFAPRKIKASAFVALKTLPKESTNEN